MYQAPLGHIVPNPWLAQNIGFAQVIYDRAMPFINVMRDVLIAEEEAVQLQEHGYERLIKVERINVNNVPHCFTINKELLQGITLMENKNYIYVGSMSLKDNFVSDVMEMITFINQSIK